MQGSRPSLNAWSSDSAILAGELRGSAGIVIYLIKERTYRRITQSGTRPIWLPGGHDILFSDGDKLRIVNADTNAVRDVTTNLAVTGMSLSADGRTLVYSDRKTEADIWMASVERGE